MRIRYQYLIAAGVIAAGGFGVLSARADDANSLSEKERNAGFELLFNGRVKIPALLPVPPAPAAVRESNAPHR